MLAFSRVAKTKSCHKRSIYVVDLSRGTRNDVVCLECRLLPFGEGSDEFREDARLLS